MGHMKSVCSICWYSSLKVICIIEIMLSKLFQLINSDVIHWIVSLMHRNHLRQRFDDCRCWILVRGGHFEYVFEVGAVAR